MFVSSYNTYVNTNTSDKTAKYKAQDQKYESGSFNSKLSESSVLKSHVGKNLPIDYVSNYKSFNNQQKLQEQVKNQNEVKFKNIQNMNSAKSAYEDNSKMFSLIKKPSVTINQTEKIDKKLPQNIQELKEKNLRHTMVNTYLENDNYYQITA